jgi:hypothetical protein
VIRKARAGRRGTKRAGSGIFSTDSRVLAETPHSLRTLFENDNETKPEVLTAAANPNDLSFPLS